MMQSLQRVLSSICILLCASTSFAEPKKTLSLHDVLSSVKRCYPKIKIALLDTHMREGEHVQSLGKFDPTVVVNTRIQPIGGYINQYYDAELQVPTFYRGIKVVGGYRKGNGDWPSYNQNYLTNSGGEYRVGFSLPLLRDSLIDKDRFNVFAARETLEANRQDANAIKISVYQESIKAYWQWVQAGSQVQVLKQLLNLAQVRQQAIIQQANHGDLPKLAITENLQQILIRQQLLNQANLVYQQAAINLSLFYRDVAGTPAVPSAERIPIKVSKYEMPPQLTRVQLQQHPALQKIQRTIGVVEAKKTLAQNELLPSLDAVAYTFKQQGDNGNPLLLPTAALVGFSFKFPILQREATGKLMSAGSELQQKITEKNFLYEQLKNQYDNLRVAIKTYDKQLQLLQKEYILAKKMEAGESNRFQEGDSTLFLVNQREQASAQARLNLINTKMKLAELIDQARFFVSTSGA